MVQSVVGAPTRHGRSGPGAMTVTIGNARSVRREEWQLALGVARVLWLGNFEVGFDCRCGARDIVVTDEEPWTCSVCGRTYRLRVAFEVAEPEPSPEA